MAYQTLDGNTAQPLDAALCRGTNHSVLFARFGGQCTQVLLHTAQELHGLLSRGSLWTLRVLEPKQL